MIGLQDGSKIEEIIVKQDKDTAIKFTVRQEIINLKALMAEKATLEEGLAEEAPSDKELIDQGKMSHPYYMEPKDSKEERIAVIDTILEKVK